MTDTTPATASRPAPTRWLYATLALTGIAVGIFVIAAGVYLLFFQSGSGNPAQPDCCKAMEADMKKMMADPNMPMNKPAAPSMSPSMSPMPSTSSMPSMPMPSHTP
ncbi:hypothetical protein [Mycobacterium gordonae]|uniref:hypothetical protein n=1 Tax=Mycobacterium gordonae TaxID=1778 RepID=UPI000AC5FBEA|nr:hypothetical protein [Mycobacterium gordonae]